MLESEAIRNNIPLTNASPAPVVSTGLALIPATLPRNFCVGHCRMMLLLLLKISIYKVLCSKVYNISSLSLSDTLWSNYELVHKKIEVLDATG